MIDLQLIADPCQVTLRVWCKSLSTARYVALSEIPKMNYKIVWAIKVGKIKDQVAANVAS